MGTRVRIKIVGGDDAHPRYATSKVFLREKRTGYTPLLPGEIVELADEEAKPLLKKLRASLEITLEDPNRESPPALAAKPARGRAGRRAPLSREEHIQRAIVSFDPNGPYWTDGGLPRVDAIEKVLGYDISSDERDAAWKAVQATRGE